MSCPTDHNLNNRHIRVRGARVHNLRAVDVDIPHESIVVITGVSGSGKSSLAFDTLFAEGQRRYLESLSTYTRQFLNQLERPNVDMIEGLPPTISIDQRSTSAHQRSTLATMTEIYDYLRLLYARAGQAHCIECGRPVSQQSPQRIVDTILAFQERQKVIILAPLVRGRKGQHRDIFLKICKEGFVRARVDGQIVDSTDPPQLACNKLHDIDVVIDRIVVKSGIRGRLQESVELALRHGDGVCLVSFQKSDTWHDRLFSSKLACPECRVSFSDLEPRIFSFNRPYGACPECKGLGYQVDVGEADVLACSRHLQELPVCQSCGGARLGSIPRSVTLAGTAIHEFTAMTVAQAGAFVDRLLTEMQSSPLNVALTAEGQLVVENTLPDIATRLAFLNQVGLDYLTLNRPTRTLSGGEFQRARLAGCLGSGLLGVCYILDEPTIGLHARDTGRLIESLLELRNRGNSIIVVEHDRDMMLRSDYLIDLGPGAGNDGGRVVAEGKPDNVVGQAKSLTGRYLNDGITFRPKQKRLRVEYQRSITLNGARRHNLKNVTVRIPLDVLTVVSGVSGSGKSSLITQTAVPALHRLLTITRSSPAHALEPSYGFEAIELQGVEHIDRCVEIDHSAIGRSGRSNPATYSGIWDEVRKVFAQTREARIRGYKPRRFSFNVRDGRCKECAGHGEKRVEMHYLPDMFVQCFGCRGARFNRQTLAIRFRGKTVADVLRMRIEDAVQFFENFPRLQTVLKTFSDVGLGYLRLGQSSLTLSGGEAQRVKLATELSRADSTRTLFVLDEPTTGLHMADVEKLIELLRRLVEQGNSVLVIEHQLDVIASADWVIDMGPDGGDQGGTIVAEGTPEEVASGERGHTATALQQYFMRRHKDT